MKTELHYSLMNVDVTVQKNDIFASKNILNTDKFNKHFSFLDDQVH